jgi:TatD DNase family protein
MIIDTHCHLAFNAFNDSWREIVESALKKDITMITVGAAKESSEKSIKIAEEIPFGVFASIGIHPTHQDQIFIDDFDKNKKEVYSWLKKNSKNKKVVAIGETGIDYYHLEGSLSKNKIILERQKELLAIHLLVAKEEKLPVILHSRDVSKNSKDSELKWEDTSYGCLFQIIKDFGYQNCVLHCFGGDWKTAKMFLDLGAMISFTGIVTFKNLGESLKEVIKNVPKDRFMVETDSPYLAPEPHRGKQNNPSFLPLIIRGIAEIRGESYDKLASQTAKNSKIFFGIQ